MKWFLSILFLMVCFLSESQIITPAKWSHKVYKAPVNVGDTVDLVFEVFLNENWYIYSTDFVSTSGFGPVPTKFEFKEHFSYELIDEVISVDSQLKTDDLLGLIFRYIQNSPATFRQSVKILSKNPVIEGNYEYQVCTLVDGKCIPGQGEFNFTSLLASDNASCNRPIHGELFHFPYDLEGYFDLKQALDCAREKNKPLLVDFTGHGCINCRKMEKFVWSNHEVQQKLRDDYILVSLYVDDRTLLNKEKWYISSYDGKEKKTIGSQNADYQITQYNNNAQPLYVLIDHEENLLVPPRAFNLDVQGFLDYLGEGSRQFVQNAQ